MPFMPPLKPSQPQPKAKVHRDPPPGGGRPRKIKLATRDPRRRGG